MAKKTAKRVALDLGFSARRAAEAELVASELAFNHVMHKTKQGIIRITGLDLAHLPVLTIASLDEGPGIANLSMACSGKTPFGKGLGAGLAAVARLADEFSACSCLDTSSPCPAVAPEQGHGTVICATLRPGSERPGTRSIGWPRLAGIIAPRPSGGQCGDRIIVQTDGRYLRVTVIDTEGISMWPGKEGHPLVQNLERLALLWPPDRVLDQLKKSCLPGQPSARILLVDLLSGSVQSAGMGNVRLVLHALQETGGYVTVLRGMRGEGEDPVLIGSIAELWIMAATDGLPPPPPLIQRPGWIFPFRNPPIMPCIWTQVLFPRHNEIRDDASLMVLTWQRRSASASTSSALS